MDENKNYHEEEEMNVDQLPEEDAESVDLPDENLPGAEGLPDRAENEVESQGEAEAEEEDDEPALVIDPKKLKIIQWIIGIVAGLAISACFWFIHPESGGEIEGYLWVIIFAAVMLGSNYYEKQLKKRLMIMKMAMAGVVAVFLVFLLIMGLTGNLPQ